MFIKNILLISLIVFPPLSNAEPLLPALSGSCQSVVGMPSTSKQGTTKTLIFEGVEGLLLPNCEGTTFKNLMLVFSLSSEPEAITLFQNIKSNLLAYHGEIDERKTQEHVATAYLLEFMRSDNGVIATYATAVWSGDVYELSVVLNKLGEEWSVTLHLINH